MKTNSEKTANAAKPVESIRLELEKCQRELKECQERIKQMEALSARESYERQQTEEKLKSLNVELAQQAAELKVVNQTLLVSEQRLRIAIETGRIGLFVWDSTQLTNPGDWSNQLKEIFGLPLDAEVTHDMFLKCVHPDDREHIDQCVMKALKGENGGEYKTEYRTIRPDNGLEHWVTARGQAFFDSKGKAIRFIGTVMDITERKQAEQSLNNLNAELEERIAQRLAELSRANQALQNEITERKRIEDQLRQNQAYLAEAQRLSQTGSFGWNISTGKIIWSKETYCIFEYDPEQKPTLELVFKRIDPKDIAFVQQTLDRATRDEMDLDFEHRLLMPDGEKKYVHVMARAAKFESGEVEFVGAVMDITEQKRLENRLRQSEKNLAEGQRLTKTGSWILDYHTGNTDWSVETCRIFGFPDPPPSPHYSEFRARVRPEDREGVDRGLRESFETGEPRPLKYIFELPTGVTKHIETISQPVKDETGKVLRLMGTVMDVTERTQVAEALRASEHLARGQLEALTGALAALSKQSEPEKLLELVLAMIVRQLEAHSLGVYEMNENTGRVQLLGNYEDSQLHIATSNESQISPQFGFTSQYHPIWTEFFRTGAHCVIGDIQSDKVHVRIAEVSDSPWYDWSSDVVLIPPVKVLLKQVRSAGIVSTLVVPMLIAGKVTGLFSIRFEGQRFFQLEEIELTRALSHQAMLAIQLMRLSQQSRETAVMAERNRMARDIHDTLAQGFTGVIMQLEAAKGAATQGDLAEAVNRIERASNLARSSLGEARRSVRALRPRSLRSGKLFLALDDLLKRMTEGTNLNAEFQAEGDERAIPSDYEEGLLRITQEALTNAVKHANARNFKATLSIGADKIQLRLVDDGRGFDPQKEHDGFGLIGMKERVDRMGGEFIIRTKQNVGTEILVELKHQSALKPENGNE